MDGLLNLHPEKQKTTRAVKDRVVAPLASSMLSNHCPTRMESSKERIFS